MEHTSFGKIAEQQQDGGSKPPPYDHRYRLYIFIEQKTPADLEESAGAFYLFTAEPNKPTYDEDEPFDDFSNKNITLWQQLFFR